VSGTNNAVISGASFNPANALAITMTADNGAPKAQPATPLNSNSGSAGTSFIDAWSSTGP
jgi:hypothetical protein